MTLDPHFSDRPFLPTEDPVIDWKEFDDDGHRVLMGRVMVRGKLYELMIRAQIADIKFNPEQWHFQCEDAKARARREIKRLLSRGSDDDRI